MHITFITVYCHNCSILLLVVDNLLLCLLYKLHLIIDVYIQENNINRVWYYRQFQASSGSLGKCPPQIRGATIIRHFLSLMLFNILFGGKNRTSNRGWDQRRRQRCTQSGWWFGVTETESPQRFARNMSALWEVTTHLIYEHLLISKCGNPIQLLKHDLISWPPFPITKIRFFPLNAHCLDLPCNIFITLIKFSVHVILHSLSKQIVPHPNVPNTLVTLGIQGLKPYL